MLLSAAVPTLSIAAPVLSTAPAELQRSLEFQSSILVLDLENAPYLYWIQKMKLGFR
jgi:hypothetical protein